MIFSSFTIAIFIASLENKRISSLVGTDPDLTIREGWGGGGGHPDPEIMGGRSPKNILVRK